MKHSLLFGAVLTAAMTLSCTQSKQTANSKMFTPLPYNQAVAKADSLLALMTTDEKITLIGGTKFFYSQAIPRLGIPMVMMTDATGGVHLRNEFIGEKYTNAIDKSTSFPAPIMLSSTWNRQLAHDYAQSIGEECRAAGIPVLLGPGMNIYRISQCGRNFEYFGEDPYLSGQMVASYVNGLQSTGVIATLKHFVANNTDFFRRKSNSVVDDRAIHEIYTPAFKSGIDAGARAVMTSYNQLNGEWCGQSETVISDLLRKQLDFKWLVMTDWWSVYDGEKVLKSGQNIEMPSSEATKNAKQLLDNGTVSIEQIDNMVRHLLTTYISMGSFNIKPDSTYVAKFPQHEEVALQTAREGVVMLKNNGILPLSSQTDNILATGIFINELPIGGGSATVIGYNPVTLGKALQDEFGNRILVQAEASDDQVKNASAVVLSIGTLDSEGYDRPFELPADLEQKIKHTIGLNPNTIVVVNSGSGIRMTDWDDQAAAVLYGWYPGQNGNMAIAEILSGKTNPSGKLPMTIERDFAQTPGYGYMNGEPFYTGWNDAGEKAHPVFDVNYHEGIFVGYRWFDAKQIEPLYPFGFGLSYTTFDYSDLQLKPLANNSVEVSFTVKNTGTVEGKETAQLYVRDAQSTLPRPTKELKAFEKVSLMPGESQKVTLTLDKAAFSYYNPDQKGWVLEPGEFEIWVGASSRDIKLQSTISL